MGRGGPKTGSWLLLSWATLEGQLLPQLVTLRPSPMPTTRHVPRTEGQTFCRQGLACGQLPGVTASSTQGTCPTLSV